MESYNVQGMNKNINLYIFQVGKRYDVWDKPELIY